MPNIQCLSTQVLVHPNNFWLFTLTTCGLEFPHVEVVGSGYMDGINVGVLDESNRPLGDSGVGDCACLGGRFEKRQTHQPSNKDIVGL